MSLHLSIPFSIPKVSVGLVAGYALWVLLAGTVEMPSWFLRHSVLSSAINLDKMHGSEKRQDSVFSYLPGLAWIES